MLPFKVFTVFITNITVHIQLINHCDFKKKPSYFLRYSKKKKLQIFMNH